MSYTNGRITGNVTIPDLQAALGTNYTKASELCTHPNIRKYSRYKPYAFGGILPNGLYGGSKTHDAGNSTADAIIKANNFGMEPTLLQLPAGNTLTGYNTAWRQWRPPSGKSAVDSPSGIDEPCRLGDFLGYDTKAVSYMEGYEIFGDISENLFVPISNGMMGVRLTINTKTGSSISPHEFTIRGSSNEIINLNNTCLTIIVANLSTKNKFLIAQSLRTIEDAVIESLWNTMTNRGTLEAVMDLTDAAASDISTFMGGNTSGKIFMAVGLAEPVSPALPQTELTDTVKYVTTSSQKMPVSLVSFDMWDEKWKLVAIQDGFAVNANKKFLFNLPYVSTGTPTASVIKATSGNVSILRVTIGGSFQFQSLFYTGTTQQINDYYNGKYTSAQITAIKNFINSGWGNAGLIFTVNVYEPNSSTPIVTKRYSILMPDGLNGDRKVTFGSAPTFYPAGDTYLTWPISGSKENAQKNGSDYFGTEKFPSDSSYLFVQYQKNTSAINVTKLTVEVDCEVVCFPYRLSTEWQMPVPVIMSGGSGFKSGNILRTTITL